MVGQGGGGQKNKKKEKHQRNFLLHNMVAIRSKYINYVDVNVARPGKNRCILVAPFLYFLTESRIPSRDPPPHKPSSICFSIEKSSKSARFRKNENDSSSWNQSSYERQQEATELETRLSR